MPMSIVVKKSTPIVVLPLEPVTTSAIIKLSSFDKGFETIEATMLLAFEHPIHETSETIKRALSQALVHYYPFAGRLVAAAADTGTGDEGDVHIQCSSDSGVLFIAASASCALEDLSSARARTTLLHKLAVHSDPDDSPLLVMQVTEFSCRGFVLGVTWNHAVADAAGMGQFLQAIGELARGLPSPSVVPVRSDDSLPRLPANKAVPLELNMPHVVPFSHLAFLDIIVPSSLVGRIKDEFGIRSNGQQACTLFDAVSALMWQCHTSATMSDPDAPALLVFPANVRKHVAGLKEAYYGNCITAEIVTAKSGSVARGDIIDLVNLVNHTKQKIGDELFKNNTQQSAAGQEEEDEAAALQVPYNMLTISSWRNLGLDEADFGSGRPARLAHCVAEDQPCTPFFVLLPECKGKVGAIMLSATMKEEHAEAFLRELASFT